MKFESILSDVLFSSARTGMTIVRGLAVIPILTKLLGVDEYGLWVSILAIVTIVSGIGGLHLKGSLIRYTPRESTEGQTFVDILSIAILSAVACSLLFFAADSTIGIIPEQDAGSAITVSVTVLIGLYILSEVILNYPRAMNDVKRYEVIQVSQILVETVALVTVFVVTRSLVAGFLTLIAVSGLFTSVLLVVFLPKRVILPDTNRFPRYFRYSLPMVPKVIGTRVITNADKYIILYFLSPTAVGVYAVAYSVAKFFENLTSVLNPTLYPKVIRAWDREDVRDLQVLYGTIFRWYSLLAFPAFVGMVLLSEEILLVLSTPAVAADGWVLLSVLAFGFLVRGYDNPLAYIFNALEDNTKIARIIVAAATANVGLNVLLIPLIGVPGAVVATFLSQISIMIYMLHYSRKQVSFRIPFESIAKALVASISMAIVLLMIPVEMIWWQKLLTYPLVGSAIYFSSLILLGEVSKTEILEIINKTNISW